jgi:hypothetical protein
MDPTTCICPIVFFARSLLTHYSTSLISPTVISPGKIQMAEICGFPCPVATESARAFPDLNEAVIAAVDGG